MRAKIVVPLLVLIAAAPAAAQAVCPDSTGRAQQSPVDIRRATATTLGRLVTHYPAGTGRLFNDGKRVQVDVHSGSVTVDGVDFALEEFHFHWPAEHELIGDRPAAEIHMVHKAGGRIAVVGTWIRVGARNHAWDEIWARLPAPGDAPRDVNVSIEQLFGFRDLNTARVYRYCGSLTTPDYAEDVTWLMRRTAITMSAAQIAKLHSVMRRYSRDVQPLNGRVIRYRAP
jgi:carbonic anhydrase